MITLAFVLHKRNNISEPNSEARITPLPEEILPKICAVPLEQGTGDSKNVAKHVNSRRKRINVSSKFQISEKNVKSTKKC